MIFYFIPFISMIFLYLLSSKYKDLDLFFIFFQCIYLIIFVGLRGPIDRDYFSYAINYFNGFDNNFYEPTIRLISYIANYYFNSPVFIFFSYALLSITLKWYALKKISPFFYLSAIWYLCTFFNIHELTQIRAGVASGFFLIMIFQITKKNYKLAILFYFVSTLFHFSFFITFIVFFLNKEKKVNIYFVIFSILFALFISQFIFKQLAQIPFISSFSKISLYLNNEMEKGKLLNPFMLIRLVIFFLLIYKQNYLIKINPHFIFFLKIYWFSFFIYYLLLQNAAFSLRIKEIFGIIEIVLIPYIIFLFKERFIMKIFFIILSFGLLVAYLYYIDLFLPYKLVSFGF